MPVFFFWVGIGRGTPTVILGHVAPALPYVTAVVAARFQIFDAQLEAAAPSLGEGQWVVTRDLTLPWFASGVVAGALFAFPGAAG